MTPKTLPLACPQVLLEEVFDASAEFVGAHALGLAPTDPALNSAPERLPLFDHQPTSLDRLLDWAQPSFAGGPLKIELKPADEPG